MKSEAYFTAATAFVFLAGIGLPTGLGIVLTEVTIPAYGVKDGAAELGCEFTLESETLLVLKWYKSEEEFFRYLPNSETHTLTFPVDGVFVDLSKSGLNKVVLRNITLQTSGVYKCEVSIEGSFRTLSKQGHMVIIAPPRSDPLITGVQPAVNIGDRVSGNCTSYRSTPPAILTIYINDEKVDIPEVIKYPIIFDADGLETSVLGFSFLVDPRHFRNGIISLKCTATIGNFYWVKTQNISDANIKVQLSFSGHNRLSSGGRVPGTTHQNLPFMFFMHVLLLHFLFYV